MTAFKAIDRFRSSESEYASYLAELTAFVSERLAPNLQWRDALYSLDRYDEPEQLARINNLLTVMQVHGPVLVRLLRSHTEGVEQLPAKLRELEEENEVVRLMLEEVLHNLRQMPGLRDFLAHDLYRSDRVEIGPEGAELITPEQASTLNMARLSFRRLHFRDRLRAVDGLVMFDPASHAILTDLQNRMARLPQHLASHPEVLNLTGHVAFALGHPDQALAAYEQALEGCVDRQRRGLLMFNALQASAQAGSYDKTLRFTEQLIERGDASFELFDSDVYTPLRVLRAGTYGITYIAMHQAGSKRVIHSLWGGERKFSAVFEVARRLSQVDTPYVSRTKQWSFGNRKSRQFPFLVGEYAGVTSLRAYVAEHGVFQPTQAISVLVKIAEGVHAAHQRGILHADLNPENVMLRPQAERLRPRVVNFGLGPRPGTLSVFKPDQYRKESMIHRELRRSFQYTAPEQHAHTNVRVSPATDIYAFGLLGQFLLCGSPQPDEAILKALGIPAAHLLGVLGRCLEQDPERRYQSFLDVLEALKTANTRLSYRPASQRSESPLWWSPPAPQKVFAASRKLPVAMTDLFGMQMVLVPPGVFLMGSKEAAELGNDERQHRVSITRPFYMKATPVTQDEFQALMGSCPAQFSGRPQLPAENVSWFDAVAFCNAMSEREGLDPVYELGEPVLFHGTARNGYRLPTEAEWEYACRAGSTEPFWHGRRLREEHANFGLNVERPSPVRFYPPNPWGLFDMHGNVWEWCNDWYGPYPSRPATDPIGPRHGEERVARGGSWGVIAMMCTASVRDKNAPQGIGNDLGFRIVRSVV